MNVKWIFGIGIGIAIIASFYFVIQLNLNMAVLSMVGLFALTNGMRAKTFHDQGLARESKWMKWVSYFFVLAFIVLIIIYSVI
ncbi:hypothetical protein [Sporosarcina jiandibaonis]|uniref:hypothetical protein n=1 Tax=Sporosarcina jiandibaonis TaxID=2715535 RepID=UPI001554FA9D|nr:hypothetical protein [Sporosarcina jiandibaonis]